MSPETRLILDQIVAASRDPQKSATLVSVFPMVLEINKRAVNLGKDLQSVIDHVDVTQMSVEDLMALAELGRALQKVTADGARALFYR